MNLDTRQEHLNVGTIGHVDHGKTTTTSAITHYLKTLGLSKEISYEEIDKTQEERTRGITINATIINYFSKKREYAHVDCPGHRDYIKNMITGAAQIDAAILVVSAEDGVMPQTKEHVSLAKKLGVKQIIVFLNKVDKFEKDDQIIDFVKMDLTDLLDKNGYKNTPIVQGSAKKALENDVDGLKSIENLINTMDDYFHVPERDITGDFFMYIDGVISKTGQGTVVTGKVERGTVKAGDKVEIIGLTEKKETMVKSVEAFRQSMSEAYCGDNVGILLKGIAKDEVTRGQVICKKDSIKTFKRFKSEIYALKQDEGGRKTGFGASNKYAPQFYFKTAHVTGTIILPEDVQIVEPGDRVSVEILLIKDVALLSNADFTFREGGITVGIGRVLELIE